MTTYNTLIKEHNKNKDDIVGINSQLAESTPILAQTLSSEEIDIFLVYGQSNAMGYAYNTTGDPTFKTPNVTVWNGVTEIPLTNYMPTSQGETSTGGAWVSFANEYARKTGRKAIIGNCAKGSMSIDDLSKNNVSGLYTKLIEWGNNIKTHIMGVGKSVGKVVVLFCQGEKNSFDLSSTTDYATKLSQLWTDIKLDISANLMAIFTVGYYQDDRKLYAWVIQSIQREFSKANNDVIIAFDDIETLASNGMKCDGVHLNQIGYNYMGQNGAKTVTSTLYIDKSYQQSELIKRQGLINLDGSQEWKYYGGWLTKANNFVPTTITARAITNIVDVSMQTDHLRIVLADNIDYVLSANANLLPIDSAGVGALIMDDGSLSIRPIIDQKLYNTVDSQGRTVIRLYFVANLSVRIKMAEKTIDTALQGTSLVNNLSATFTTGQCIITHPYTKKLSIGYSRDKNVPYIVTTTNNTITTTVSSFNLTGALANSECMAEIKEVIINPTTLFSSAELMLSIIGAKKKDS